MVVRGNSINEESSGRNEGTVMEDIDLPITVTGSGRRREQSIETVTLGTIDSTVMPDSGHMDTASAMNEENTTGYDETSTRISESTSGLKFQPLQPIAEKSFASNSHQSNPENDATEDQNITQTSAILATKESGSFMNNIQDPVAASKVFKKAQGESDDDNLSSTHLMSHTPPTSVSTSYETMHFGKRPRSGVSSFFV